ncbi:site-specific integrase [bacterium]|nr:site-specific integrase [bacterium]
MLQWHDPESGRRRSRSAQTADPREAEQKARDLEYELSHGTYQEPSKLDWQAFREAFEDEYLPGVRERTREKYGTVLDVFEQIVQPTKLRAITERTISLFLKGMRERKVSSKKIGLAPMTQKNYLIALKAALGWAAGQKFLPAVPTFPEVKVPKKKPQPIPQADFDKLIAVAPDDRWRAYLLCGWWCGLRLSEALRLRWEKSPDRPWVDLEQNRIVLPAEFAKSAEDQWAPLHPVLREAIAKLPRDDDDVFPFRSRNSDKPLSRAGVTNRVLLLAKKAGVPLSMHRLRKGFGCRVAKKLGKGNAPVLHRLMRHSSMQITMDYYASVDDALHDAIADL